MEVLIEKKDRRPAKSKRMDPAGSKKLSNQCLATEFGMDSKVYHWCNSYLGELYKRAISYDSPRLHQIYQKWKTTYAAIYGNELFIETFINHVYLTILIKSILYLKATPWKNYSNHLKDYLADEFFDNNYADIFSSLDLTGWLAVEPLYNDSLIIADNMLNILSEYDLEAIDEDIFRDLYEQLIEQADRHKAGEYYTPKWLVELILEKVFSLWENTFPPKIIDPACGSGTFLFHATRYLINRYKKSPAEVIKKVAGFDTNPMAVIVSKTNLVLSSGVNKFQSLPVYHQDALKDSDLFDSNGNIKAFDIMVGNPPWIVLRSIKVKHYQTFLKKEMSKYHLLNSGDTHLHTQLDTATLFFRKCADKYLSNGGIIAFVMPRSVIGSTLQHHEFRKFTSPPIKLLEVVDLENVNPLFNMPACVLIGKKGSENLFPVPLEKYEGQLPNRDVRFPEAISRLSLNNEKYIPSENGENISYYYDKFKVGLSIFPRSLYFADLVSVNGESFQIKTSPDILKIVKDPWKHELSGVVKQEFIYATVLPYEMVPFGILKFRAVILPLLSRIDNYELLDFDNFNDSETFDWFSKAQKIWDANKTDISKERFPELTDRLNYNNLLSFQHPNNRYIVLYNATGKNITSCVVDKSNLPELKLDGYSFPPKGFVADVKTWFYETNSKAEAHFLSAILNSAVLNKLIKPYQPRGLFGARAIHRRPLQFPIPKFDVENELHSRVASIGENLCFEVKELTENKSSKSQIKKIIGAEIIKIDVLVNNLFNLKG